MPPPAWVITLLKKLLAEGKDKKRAAALITAAGHPCTPRQVKRWKATHGLRQVWRGTNAQLDRIVQQLHNNDELGAEEGHAWLHSVVNEAIGGGERVEDGGSDGVREGPQR